MPQLPELIQTLQSLQLWDVPLTSRGCLGRLSCDITHQRHCIKHCQARDCRLSHKLAPLFM